MTVSSVSGWRTSLTSMPSRTARQPSRRANSAANFFSSEKERKLMPKKKTVVRNPWTKEDLRGLAQRPVIRRRVPWSMPRCAVEIQNAMVERNAGVPADRRER